MNNKEKIKLLWEQVRHEDDLHRAVNMIAELSEQEMSERMEDTLNLHKTIEQLDVNIRAELKSVEKVLYGNGDPTHSIIARLDKIEEQQHKFSESVNKLVWVIVSAVVVQIVLYLIRVL